MLDGLFMTLSFASLYLTIGESIGGGLGCRDCRASSNHEMNTIILKCPAFSELVKSLVETDLSGCEAARSLVWYTRLHCRWQICSPLNPPCYCCYRALGASPYIPQNFSVPNVLRPSAIQWLL